CLFGHPRPHSSGLNRFNRGDDVTHPSPCRQSWWRNTRITMMEHVCTDHGATDRCNVATPDERGAMASPRASIRDVASLADVSVGTVSNVLNHPDRVSPATRERVETAVEKLGFVRNESARQLRAGHSGMIGLVVLDAGNPFFTDV